MATIRALIVDDEPLARERLRGLLETEPDVTVVGECSDGEAAVEVIRAEPPDLVFLDVQMPNLDGFGVVAAVGPENMPVTVFVTAYDRYALQAFEVHALDYLLKPFDRARFAVALARVRAQLEQDRAAGAADRLLALLDETKTPPRKGAERIAVKTSGGVSFVRAEEIDWVEAAGNYAKLHAGGDVHLLRETLNALEARLDPEQFVRIHRSTIVNLDAIKELQPLFHGDYAVILRDGTELVLSRSYRQKLKGLFGNAL